MAEDAPPAAPVMTPEEVQAKAELRMRDIGQRFGAIPEDHDELLRLLEEAVFCLSRVDQSPPESMYNALRPTMAVLITNELLEHPDPNVKVVLTSCLTEVTRITALEGAPYDDDVMKHVFKRIVETFGDLDDMNSPSFSRRVSILDSVARVRCCVLMLDLDLDHMILDMFRHFFKTASTRHSEQVIHCMEIIMMFVIQESDDVHAELASCLLQNLKKEAQETLPASFGLAERVLGLCRDKLKPVLHELLKGTPLDEYSNVVTMLFQDASDAGENNVDASGKDMAAEGKLSEKSVPDESPQETSKVDQNVNCLGQEGTSPSSTPTTAISNGAAPVDNVKSPDGPDSLKQKQELTSGDEQTPDSSKQKQELTSGDEQTPDSSKQKPELTSLDKQAKSSEQLISCDKEVREPVIVKTEKLSDVNSKKDHKLGSSIGSEMSEQSKVVKDNESLVASELSPETNDGDKKQLSETGNITAEESSKPTDTKPAVAKPKRGRPPAAKSQEKKPVGKKHASSDLKSAQLDPVTDSGGRATRQLNKDVAKSSSTKAAEGESGKKQHKTMSMKLQKEDAVSNKDTDEDISLKEMVSPTRIDKSKGQQEDSGASSKRKRLQEAQETPLSKKNKMLDENLIGSRIKVWWPDDKMFYAGVVESFEASSKKHKVSYDDGDVEVLVLKKERWEFIAEEQDTDPSASFNMRRGRKAKGSSGQQMKEGKTGTPQSGSDVKNPPKKRGRQKGVRSSNNMPNAGSSVTPARLKGKSAEKDTQGTPKIGSNSKKKGAKPSRSTGKAKDAVVKASSKDEPDSTDNSKDDAGSEDKNSKNEVKSSEAIDGSKTN
ncbi:sister chromatid cohesion protein PDS5 homolog C-like [Miscanthus floridulus]|uniref:sister chromatid cohesion protein PDS5 homolog C-like n=1 Tax=Miscanthus floridulus TaxID=154761 RepID=UPI00345B37C2